MAHDGDQRAADHGAWESVEAISIAPVAATGHPRATLAGGLLVLGFVVGLGLWPVAVAGPPVDAGTPPCPAAVATPEDSGAGPSVTSTVMLDGPTPTSAIGTRPPIALLMPSPGEVILGPSVPVAGRVGAGRPEPGVASASAVHVVFVVGDTVVGANDVPVSGNGFAGSIAVIEQARGEVAEMRISDSRRPDLVLLEQEVVLGPGSG